MDFISGFFVGSTIWFWIFIIIECGILFAFIEYEKGFAAFFSIVVTLLVFKYLLGLAPMQYVWAHPGSTLMYAISYVIVGVVYALIRWDRKGAKWRRRYDEGDAHEKKESLRYAPKARNSKNSIVIWMMYWPISATWWLISDFVRELFVTLYHKLSKVLDRITDRHTKGINFPESNDR